MLGYDIAARILLNVSDWSQATMISAGNWGKKAPKLEREIRPWIVAQKKAKSNEGMEIRKLQAIFAAKAAR